MEPNAAEAMDLMAEGDRLLGRAWEYGRPAKSGLSAADLEMAEYYYAHAAQAYLVGAVEYQHGRAAASDGTAMEDPTELVRSLDGPLRAEAEEALSQADREAGGDDPIQAAERARMFAEELRDRFAHAAPELFHGAVDVGIEHQSQDIRSR